MPNPANFLKGFNLYQGLVIAGFTLIDVQIQHVVIKAYNEYKYPITMTFRGTSTPSSVLTAFDRIAAGGRVVYTSYGNPYDCTLGDFEITQVGQGSIVVTAMGHAVRHR